MPRNCVIRNCHQSVPATAGTSVSLHGFPKLAAEKQHWLNFIGKSNFNRTRKHKIPQGAYLCSRHFQSCCFTIYGRLRTIKPGHVPSISFDKAGNSNIIQKCNSPSAEIQMETNCDIEPHADLELFESRPPEMFIMEKKIASFEEIFKNNEHILAGKENTIRNQKRLIQNLKKTIRRQVDKTRKSTVFYKIQKNSTKRNQKSKSVQTTTSEVELSPVSSLQNFKGIFNTLFARTQKPKNFSYNDDLRRFAVKLNYYSPKAYEFLREIFCNTLPHFRTITAWTNGIRASPGFLPDALKFILDQSQMSQNQDYYCLSLDEVHIRKQMVFSNGEMKGFTDYGEFDISKPSAKMAANALFVMATQLNGSNKTPIAYILTNGCDSDLIASVISESLKKMHECRGRVVTITFDGLPANFSALELLGANVNINSPNYKPFIFHPSDANFKVYITPDPCHMVKLIRNALECYDTLLDQDGNEICWSYFTNLVNLQQQEGLKAANKLSHRHAKFTKQKMKVKLAVQLLSSSTSVALSFCEKIGLDEFQGAAATAKFAQKVDRLFDLLNSRPKGTGFKAPLARWNKNIWTKAFKDIRTYLMNLRKPPNPASKSQRTKLLLNTGRGTCIQGLVLCIDSLVLLMDELVLPEHADLDYIPTYKMSQDHIELYFSSLRQRFGFNNNPNIIQLEAALKRMMAVKIDPSLRANCVQLDESSTAAISPLRVIKDSAEKEQYDNDLPDLPSTEFMSKYVENVVAYISGFVGRAVSKKIDCFPCVSALFHSDPNFAKIRSDYVLIDEKDNGGLFIPSEDLVRVCKEIESVIREQEHLGLKKLKYSTILSSSLRRLTNSEVFPELRSTLTEDHTPLSTHVLDLLKLIVQHYVNIRLHHIAREVTISLSPECIRNHLNKTVLFSGQ